MGAPAQVNGRPTTSDAPIALVIGPPWLRTGTGRVIEDQIAFYRDHGFATAFVGVPVNAAHVPENPMWLELADAAGDLSADHVSFAVLRPAQRPNTLRRQARQLVSRRNALDWIVEVGRYSKPTRALLDFLCDRAIALFHVNHVFTLEFARRLRRQLGDAGHAPLLLETHDVQSHVLADRSEPNPWNGHTDDRESLLRSELALAGTADVLIHCSVDDRQFFVEQFPDKPHILARPAIDEAFIAAVARNGSSNLGPIDILLVGTGYDANVEAVEWFLTAVWPLISDSCLNLKIVGGVRDLLHHRRPELLQRFRDCFVGPVADLAPYYRAARSVIAPMRSGGGISIKTVEAFALGKPFVGTSKAFRGLPLEPLGRHGFQGCDDPRAFADAVLRVLSPNGNTGARGRAVYDELFARQKIYAARDEAVRLAQGLCARRPPALMAQEQARRSPAAVTRGMPDLVVLGTSNCVGPNSFIEKVAARTGARVRNLSVGACSSGCGVYQLDKVEAVRNGVALIDFAINDNDAGWNLWGSQRAPGIVEANITTMVARLRALNFLPILLISASDFHRRGEPFGHALHREICIKEQINFIDMRRIVLGAIEQGVPRDILMRDDCHLSDDAGEALSEFLAAILRGRSANSSNFVAQYSASMRPSRVVYASEIFPPAGLVDRGSALRAAQYGRIVRGEAVHIPVGAGERLSGVMINNGAKGAMVALRSGDREVIKSMTAYWNPENPDEYCAMFVDIAQPLRGRPAGVTIEIVDADAVPTEPTLHAKSGLPGRYGEIEIEGVLLVGEDASQITYAGPQFDGPLDLSELPDALRLRDRLASQPA
jgi:glycosyltransferase involved in cell wall biosynthesis